MMKSERDKLIEENLNLVWYTMRTYYPRSFTPDNEKDFFQIGCLGLIQAASTYDEHPDLSFSTYAVNIIRGYISHEFTYMNRKQRSVMSCIPIDSPLNEEGDARTYLDTIPDNRYRPDQGWYDDLSKFAKTLTPCQRRTFEKMIEGKGNVQIAKEEGCRTSCITARIDRIRLLFSRYYDIPEYYQGKKEFRPRGRPRKDKKYGTH